MNGEKTETTTTTEKPAEVVTPGREVTTETVTKESGTEVIPQVPEQQPDGQTVAKDAPTEGGTRFR